MFKQTPKKRVLFVRRFTPVLLALFGVFSLILINLQSPVIATAATASTINFQARLQSAAGAIVPDGNYNIEFKIYGASSGGTALWTETHTNASSTALKTTNGYFTTNLGSVTAFSGINWDQPLWMTMNVGGTSTGAVTWDGEMNPRLPLTAVPYAFSAGELAKTGATFRSNLSLAAPTVGNQNFVIQDQGAAGTYNLLVGGANGSGVQLQSSTPGTAQTGNFNISGTGIAGALQASSLDTASAGTLAIGTTNATTINIGTNAAAHTIAIGTGTGTAAQTVTIGSTYLTSTLTLQSGTGGITLTGNTSVGGNLSIASTKNLTFAASGSTIGVASAATAGALTLQGQTATNASAAGGNLVLQGGTPGSGGTTGSVLLQNTGGTVSVGGSAGVGTVFLNNGSTVNATLALGNFATGGAIGTAAATVDVYTSISVAQTTASQTVTVPTPTASTTYGRVIYLSNIGTQNFTLLGTLLKPGATATLVWSNTNLGATWQYAGSDGNGILNQSGSTQTADYNISGSGTIGTSLTVPTIQSSSTLSIQSNGTSALSLDSSGAGSIVLGGANATSVTIANNAIAHTIAIATGAAAQTVTMGSTSGASATNIQGGTGGINLLTNSATAFIVGRSNTNNATAFQIQDAGSNSIFNVNTSAAAITIGNGANTISISSASGYVASGTARHTKSIVLTPEYAGAVLDATNDAGGANCAANNSGTMTSGYALTNRANYYKWTTASGTSQCYDVVVQVPVPSDFSAWSTATPITINGYTSSTSTGLINLEARDTAGTAETSCNYANVTPSSVTTWSTANSTNCTIAGTYTAGGYMTLRIRMTSPASGDVRIGNITLNYLSNY